MHTIKIQFAKIEYSGQGRMLGLTTANGKNIYIQRGLGKRQTFEVLVHEMTHAALIHLKIKRNYRNHERIAMAVGKHAVAHTWRTHA